MLFRPLLLLGLLALMLSTVAQAQDLYLGSVSIEGQTLRVGPFTNVTQRPGYDNQPAFTPDGAAVLFTSIRDDGQADIYRYDIAAGATRRVTATAESEYSPTPMPRGGTFSVVRVERDSSQRLWRFDAAGSTPEIVLEGIQPVGYHAWADASHLALFVLGAPPTLQVADARTGKAEVIDRNIGRSLHRIGDRRAVSYVSKADSSQWWITEYDLRTGATSRLAPTVGGGEDHAWLANGWIVMGDDTSLRYWIPGDGTWRLAADLAAQGVTDISRIAVSPTGGRIVLVAADAPH